jgi:hypothetical protein
MHFRDDEIEVRKVKVVYAEVTCYGWDFRVHPNSVVEEWIVDDENYNGYWSQMSDCEDCYDEIKKAGLAVLEDN